MPIVEYFRWCNEPTTREILDAHLSQLLSFMYNTNKSKTAKQLAPIDFMILADDNDRKAFKNRKIAEEIKQGLSKFKQNIKSK